MAQPTPEQWAQIETLLDALLDLPPDEHAAYLDAQAPAPAIRQEVEALLAQRTDAAGWMETSVEAFAPPLLDALKHEPPSEVGTQVGPYRLVEEVGRGGMGRVFRAERADGAFEQTVAVKLIKRGLDTEEILRRFRTERQVLARLDDPRIARLLDGGQTDAGQPYFVMEYIDGQPITAYCDAHQRGTEARLRLFTEVCAAVQHAHRNLIVHRDLKPSNILVTAEGQVKLLDFGIAKLLDDEATPIQTRTDLRLMTPAYAAPEQVTGAAITTATDVYQLGVVLYELLTGHRPLPIREQVQAVIHAAILEAAPARPSTVVSTTEAGTSPEAVSAARSTTVERLRRRLAGDLDTMVLMALRKEPPRRYASVEQFADDIQRHLDGQPVLARRASRAYRARKFVQRHRLGVGLAAAFVLLLVGVTLMTTWQQAQTARERDRAQAEAARADATLAFFVDMLGAADPDENQGAAVTVQAVLDTTAGRVTEALADQPAVQAAVMDAIAQVYEKLGRYEVARQLFAEALAQRRTLPDVQAWEVANSEVRLASTMIRQDAFAEAESLMMAALGVQRADPATPPLDLAVTLNQYGLLLETMGRFEEAEPLLLESLDLRQRLFEADHPEVLSAENNLGQLYEELGRYGDAERLYRAVLEARRGEYPGAHTQLATSLNNLAMVLYRTEQYAEAEPLFLEALAMDRQLYGNQHRNVALALNNLATLYDDLDRDDEAERLHREALAIRQAVLGPDHSETGNSHANLGALFQSSERYAEAEVHHREALRILRAQFGDQPHPWVGVTLANLSGVLEEQGRRETAIAHRREAAEVLAASLGEDHLYVGIMYYELGKQLDAVAQPEAAEASYRTALVVYRNLAPPDSFRIANTAQQLGTNLLARASYAVAESLLVEAHALFSAQGRPEDRAQAAAALVELYEAMGRPEAAAPYRE